MKLPTLSIMKTIIGAFGLTCFLLDLKLIDRFMTNHYLPLRFGAGLGLAHFQVIGAIFFCILGCYCTLRALD